MAKNNGKGKRAAKAVSVAKPSVKHVAPNKQPSKSKVRSTTTTADLNGGPSSTSASASSLMPPPPLPLAKRLGNKKRKVAELDEDEGGEEITKIPILSARVRNIPQEVVDAKWGVLADKGREEIMEVVRAAERPVLMTFRKENKRVEAQGVLRGVIKKVGKSLSKVPVPPMGKDMCLNYEKLVVKNRALEAILEPDLRQIAELEAEIDKEQKRLEKDEDYYEELKKNAVAQDAIRRQKSRTMHPILRTAPPKQEPIDSSDKINLTSANTSMISSYDINSDRQLYPLTIQLQQHLSSMQGNSASLGEVTDWIQRGRAAVDEVLYQRAGDHVYDVIMGL